MEKIRFRDLVLMVLFIGVLLVISSVICNDTLMRLRDVPAYTVVENDVKIVKITEEANVRADPIRVESHDFVDFSNSFGETKGAGFTIEVPRVFKTKENLDSNGDYIGLAVEDVLATKEGQEWFPEKIKDDPDGIVWVNYKYFEIIA